MSNNKKAIVAVDVSKDKLAVYWEGIRVAKEYSNDAQTTANLAKHIKKVVKPTLVVMECTGGYEHLLCEALWQLDVPLAKVNPGRVKNFRKAKGYHAKTDKIDARAIYEYGVAIDLIPQEAPSKQLLAVKQLVLRREQLMAFRVAELNHLKAPLADRIVKSYIKKQLLNINKQIKELDKLIAKQLLEVPEIRKKHEVLKQELGVGKVLLSALLTQMPELGTLNRNAVAALVGVAPYNKDSGNARGKQSIGGGRSMFRRLLYMATLIVIRRNATLKKFYQGLLMRGKLKKVAIVACMRKFIIRLNSLAREAIVRDPLSAEQGA